MALRTYKTTLVREGSMCFIPVPFAPKPMYPSKREVEVLRDLLKALKAQPLAWERWRALSYSHQREHVEAIAGAKKPETRERRIEAAVAMVTVKPKKRATTRARTKA